jgi:TP901 family phage tail tape measure protein
VADLQKTVEIVFGAVDDVSGTIDSISKKTSDMMGDIGAATDPLAGAHDKVVMLNAALGAMAIGGLALAVNAAGQFDSQFREITTLIPDTGESVDKFRQDILNYASDSTQGLDDINSALYQAISLGVNYKDSLQAMATAEQLAVAGKSDLTSSTELLLGTLNAYGEGVDQAGKYSDAFFTIVQDGKTTIPELAQYLSQVTGTAAAAEVPIETLGAAIAAITASGAPTSQAMTQIRQVIEALIKPTKQASDYAQELGLDFSAQALAADGLEGVMAKVYDVTGGNVDQMAKLFTSSEALKGALILSRDESGKFAGALEDMENKTGATATAFEKMVKSIVIQNKKMKTNLEIVFTAIGDKLLADYSGLAGEIVKVFQSITTAVNAGTFDPILNVISSMATGVQAALSDLAKNLPEALAQVDFSKFSKSIETLSKETSEIFKSFFGDIDLTTPKGLSDALQLIINLGTKLNEVSIGIAQGWQPVAEWLGKAAKAASEMDTETANFLGKSTQMGKAINMFSDLIGGATGAMSGFGNLMNVLAVTHMAKFALSLGSVTSATSAWSAGVNALAGTAGGAAGLLGISATIGYTAGKIANDYIPGVKEAAQAVIGWADDLVDFSGKQKWAGQEAESFEKLVTALANSTERYKYDLTDLRGELEGLGYDVANLPDEAIFKIAAEADILSVDNARDLIRDRVLIDPPVLQIGADAEPALADLNSLFDQFEGMDLERVASIDVEVDKAGIESAKEELVWFDESGTQHSILIDVDGGQVDKAKKDIEEIPNQKLLEIQLQGDIDTQIAAIEAQAETAQAAFQYTAEVDIAQAQANADILTAAYEAAGTSVEALASSTADMFGALAGNMDDLSTLDKWALQSMVEDQIEMQEAALASQIELNDAQVAYMNAKTEALNRGDAMIQIDSSGLEPALEMIMWQVIEKVQIRANAESADFLLGLS